MRRIPVWVYLAIIFTIFLIVFAIVLITANFPFMVISGALTTIILLSLLIIALAWAYTHDY